jgi:hypothetical protein
MQAEILTANPASRIRILGINQTGQEASNPLAVEGNTIPWLQDVQDAAWAGWVVEWRDVIVLDEQNRRLFKVNLTSHNLTDPDEYAAVLARLKAVAGE